MSNSPTLHSRHWVDGSYGSLLYVIWINHGSVNVTLIPDPSYIEVSIRVTDKREEQIALMETIQFFQRRRHLMRHRGQESRHETSQDILVLG